MTIFVLDENPIAAAASLADCHIGAVCTDVARLLSSLLIREGCFLSKNFPQADETVTGIIQSIDNPDKMFWVFSYFEDLLNEYANRFDREHDCSRLLSSYAAGLNFVCPGIMNRDYSCKGLCVSFDDFTSDSEDAIRVSRDYYKYLRDRSVVLTYTRRIEPSWLKEKIKETNKVKKYPVYYTIKMNSMSYEYCMEVEAATAREAAKLCKETVFKETGRNAFHPTTKAPNCTCFTGLPPKKN